MASALNTALALVERNVAVFPTRHNSKIPATDHSFADASFAPEQVRQWAADFPDCNWALEPEQAGWCVIDLDCKDGKDGRDEWELLCAMHGGVPATFTVRTPSGGWHLYFKGSLPASAGKLGPGIDTRGRRSYVLLAGSEIDGKRYEVIDDREPADLPAWVGEQLALHKAQAKLDPVTCSVTPDLAINVRRAKEWVRHVPPAIEGAKGDEWTMGVAADLRKFGLTEATILESMAEWNESCAPPWPQDELARKVAAGVAQADKNQQTGLHALQEPSETTFAGYRPPGSPSPSKFAPRGAQARRQRPAVTYLVQEWLTTTGTTILAGPSNSYKSFIALDLALSVAHGRPFLDQVPVLRQGLVIYAAGEALYGLERLRIPGWCAKRGVADQDNLLTIGTVPSMASQQECDEFLMAIEEAAGGRAVVLIVVDPLARCMLGLNENDAKDAAIYVGWSEALSQRFGCQVVTVAHSAKATGQGIRGSGAFYAGADNVITVKADRVERRVEIKHDKTKEDETPELEAIAETVEIAGTPRGTLVFHCPRDDEPHEDRRAFSTLELREALVSLGAGVGGAPVRTFDLAVRLASGERGQEPGTGEIENMRQALVRGWRKGYLAAWSPCSGARNTRLWLVPSLTL